MTCKTKKREKMNPTKSVPLEVRKMPEIYQGTIDHLIGAIHAVEQMLSANTLENPNCRKAVRQFRKDFARTISIVNGIFESAFSKLKLWKGAIFVGEIDSNPETNEAFKEAFSLLIDLAHQVIEKESEYRSKLHAAIVKRRSLLLKFYEKKEKGEKILRNWKTPGKSLAPGLRTRIISDSEMDELEAFQTQ